MKSDYEKYGLNHGNSKYFQDISDKEWKNQTKEYDPYDSDTEEFLNTPNASQDFKKFPRISAKRNNDFDPLSNGSAKSLRMNKLRKMKSMKTRLVDINKVVSYDDMEDVVTKGFIYTFEDGNGDKEYSTISIVKDSLKRNAYTIYVHKGYTSLKDLTVVKDKANKLKIKYEQAGFKVNIRVYQHYPEWYMNGDYSKVK